MQIYVGPQYSVPYLHTILFVQIRLSRADIFVYVEEEERRRKCIQRRRRRDESESDHNQSQGLVGVGVRVVWIVILKFQTWTTGF